VLDACPTFKVQGRGGRRGLLGAKM